MLQIIGTKASVSEAGGGWGPPMLEMFREEQKEEPKFRINPELRKGKDEAETRGYHVVLRDPRPHQWQVQLWSRVQSLETILDHSP